MENPWKNKSQKVDISEDENKLKLEFNSEKEQTHLNLRKKKIYEILSSKRKIDFSDENSDLIKYRLNFEDIGEIPSEYKIDIPQFIEKVRINFFNFFIQFNLSLLKNHLSSKNLNINLYAVYIIDKYLRNNKFDENCVDILTEQIDDEYLLLFSSLLNKGNIKLSFTSLIILINVSYSTKGELLFGNNENIVGNIANFLGNNKNDMVFLEFGILLIKNITFQNSYVKKTLHNFKIVEFFNEIYQKYLLNDKIMENMILCLGHFINSRFSTKKDIICSINIIKSQLNQNTKFKLLYQYTYFLYNMIFYTSPDILKIMIDEDLHCRLMELFPFEEDYESNIDNNNINEININDKDFYRKHLLNFQLLIIKILGKMLSIEESTFIQKILDSGIANFLNKLLQLSNIRIIRNTFFCIQNICQGNYGQISYLFNSNTISLSLQVAKNVYEALISKNQFMKNLAKIDFVKALREIDYEFSFVIINSLEEKIIPIVKYENHVVLLFLLEGFKYLEDNKKDNELASYMIGAISKLLDFFKKDEDNYANLTNASLVEFLEKNGFKEILLKLINNSDETIMKFAENIFDEFFDKDDENDSNKININDIIGSDENDD